MSDIHNELPENEWIHKINPDDFQAIIPLPYFHVGSENIWIESKDNTQELTMIASLKTGLPTTAVQLSRTSISQTYKNYAVVTEPLEPLHILDDLPGEKPFLLLFNRKHYLNKDEERLMKAGELIYQNENIELRKLPVPKLAGLNQRYIEEVKSDFNNAALFESDGYLLTDSNSFFIHKSFDDLDAGIMYNGTGSMSYEAGHWKSILDDTLSLDANKKFKISFWVYDYQRDGGLRTTIEVVQRQVGTQKVTNYFYSDLHRHVKGFHGKWALVELNFETKEKDERLSIALRNTILKNKSLLIDELLVRESNVDIYYPAGDIVMKNCRKLPILK